MQNHDSDYQAFPGAGSSGSEKSKPDDYERAGAGGASSNAEGGGRSNDSGKEAEHIELR